MKDQEDELPPELVEIVERAHKVARDRMLRLPQAKAMLGIGGSTFWKGVKEGVIPMSVSLGPRTSAWRESELQAWIDAKTYASRSRRNIDMKAFIAALTNNNQAT
jgi:predicted DNA-binding transcriptional regulator AlpA